MSTPLEGSNALYESFSIFILHKLRHHRHSFLRENKINLARNLDFPRAKLHIYKIMLTNMSNKPNMYQIWPKIYLSTGLSLTSLQLKFKVCNEIDIYIFKFAAVEIYHPTENV